MMPVCVDGSARISKVERSVSPRFANALTAVAALGAGGVVLWAAPWLMLTLFAGGAARVAGLLTGALVSSAEAGWMLTIADQPLAVNEACSATDFFLMTAALLGWHVARRVQRSAFLPVAAAGAVILAVPATLFVNALRIVAVAHAHRWIIPRFPAAYDSFLHLLTGVAVFLPALIALNLFLEIHASSRESAARS